MGRSGLPGNPDDKLGARKRRESPPTPLSPKTSPPGLARASAPPKIERNEHPTSSYSASLPDRR